MGSPTTLSPGDGAVQAVPGRPDAGAGPATGWTTRLHDGTTTHTRLAAAGDLPSVNALHARCSQRSLVRRYLTGRRGLSSAEWRALTSPSAGLTWVTQPADEPGCVIAVTHVLCAAGTSARGSGAGPAELALLVDDGWQSRGLGSELVRRMVGIARQRGHDELHALVLAENRPALALAHLFGAVVVPQGSQCTVRLTLTRQSESSPRRAAAA
ncbi:GNAT family N-acetyltransferase [Streptomyces sp. NPDC044984]|uniref:GNAT family N-acetyltransferase n=1 Tax=Streptomyces sp. NPDC044984 TaxID=3154335 RepID=UPI0033D733D1